MKSKKKQAPKQIKKRQIKLAFGCDNTGIFLFDTATGRKTNLLIEDVEFIEEKTFSILPLPLRSVKITLYSTSGLSYYDTKGFKKLLKSKVRK